MKITNILITITLFSNLLLAKTIINKDVTENLSKQNLSFSAMAKKSLENVNLNGADVSFAQLAEANLKNANLVEIIATATQFARANLSGAIAYSDSQTRHANFSESSFMGANLSNANFSKARFFRANLLNANLTDTIFNETNMVGTYIRNANISGAIFNNVPILYDQNTKIYTYIANIDDLKRLGAVWLANKPPRVECSLCNQSKAVMQTQIPVLKIKK